MIDVRRIKTSDVASLKKNVFPNNNLAGVKKSVKKSISLYKKGNGFRFVATEGNEIYGNIELIRNSHPFLRHRGEIYSLIVSEKRRRKGIGSRLVTKCIEVAKDIKLKMITLSVRSGTAAERFYSAVGFKKYGELPGGLIQSYDGVVYNQSFYYKKIT